MKFVADRKAKDDKVEICSIAFLCGHDLNEYRNANEGEMLEIEQVFKTHGNIQVKYTPTSASDQRSQEAI